MGGNIRTVCLIGPQGTGKTSLAEALLFAGGALDRMGRVDAGTSAGDHTEEEITRKISIHLSLATFRFRETAINLLITPGYADFEGETRSGLAACDAAVLVLDGAYGMVPAAVQWYEYCRERRIPCALFINKLDAGPVDFDALLLSLKEKTGKPVAAVAAPLYDGNRLSGVADLLREPPAADPGSLRERLVDEICAQDDRLAEEYLQGSSLAGEALVAALRNEFAAQTIIPVAAGSALENIGAAALAALIVDCFPGPAAAVDARPFSALVFKTSNEPGMGHLNFIRIWTGRLTAGSDILNVTRSLRERAGQIYAVSGRKRTDVQAAAAGEIVALPKLKDTRTNDVMGEEAGFSRIEFPAPVYSRAVVSTSRDDDEKAGHAMAYITMENPAVRYGFDAETHEMILAGAGALQMEIISEIINHRYGARITMTEPRVAYCETIRGTACAQGKYKRQSGGRGQYGDCWLRMEPLPRGAGLEFVNEITGGVIPRNYIPAVEKGVREAREEGVVAGYPVTDLRVTVYDGSYHEVDSSELAFKIAASMAFRKGVAGATPVILEPVAAVEVLVPEEFTGAVIGDITAKRGRILGLEKAGPWEKLIANVPRASLHRFAVDLRPLTRGSGRFTMRHSHYDELLPELAAQVARVSAEKALRG